jgi:hypothetical protein
MPVSGKTLSTVAAHPEADRWMRPLELIGHVPAAEISDRPADHPWPG